MSEAFNHTTDQIFSFIQQYIRDKGFPPSFKDIEEACLVSRGTVVRHLDRLETQKRISRIPGQARSIHIINSHSEK